MHTYQVSTPSNNIATGSKKFNVILWASVSDCLQQTKKEKVNALSQLVYRC